KKPVRHLSIKQKLTLIIMTVTTVALFLILVGFVGYEFFTFRQKMRHDLSTQAQMVGGLSTAALTYDDIAEAQRILAALANREHVATAAIYKGNTLFARYPTNAATKMFPMRPEPGDSQRFNFKRGDLELFHEIKLTG